MRHYTYVHLKKNTNTIFYAGMGCGRRAYSKVSRNKHWHNIVNKYGYDVKIIKYFSTHKEAAIAEIKLIAKHRKLDSPLVNKTDGGDGGSFGRVWRKSTCKLLSEKLSGTGNPMYGKTWSKSKRENFSKSRRGKGNPFFNHKQSEKTKAKMRKAWEKRRLIPISEVTRKKLSESRTGKKNHRYGKHISEKTRKKMRLAALKRRKLK
jgi:hypothetical protein